MNLSRAAVQRTMAREAIWKHMKFLKLDTGVIRNFDAARLGEVKRVSTSYFTAFSGLARLRGWGPAMGIALKGLIVQPKSLKSLVEGNVARKRIRLPWLFGNRVISGFYGWVKSAEAAVLRPFLQDLLAAENPDITIVYNGSNYPESVLADVSSHRRRVFVEGGFFPKTLQIDPVGLNAANSVPRDPAFYLETQDDFTAEGLPELVNNRPSKGRFEPVSLAPGFVFVPFQVPSDMQVTLHSPWIRDMGMFQDAICDLADACPDETFVIKEHPSFKRSVIGRRSHPRVIYANGNVTSELIQQSRAVITLNSTVGIEALLLERPVITLGNACYNVEGLVLHAAAPDALVQAVVRSRDWQPDDRLRRQFIGYLWNRYLIRGTYDAPPEHLGDEIASRCPPTAVTRGTGA